MYTKPRDENLPLFRGFPLFLPKFAEINCFRFDPICSNLLHFGGGIGVFLFFEKILFSSLKTPKTGFLRQMPIYGGTHWRHLNEKLQMTTHNKVFVKKNLGVII